MSAVRRRIHVQHTLPDLVEQILPEATPPLEQRLEFRGLRVTYERRHMPKATAARGHGIPHRSSPAVPTGWLPTAADPPQRSHQPHVADGICELRPPRRLQVRDQIQLAPIVGSVVRSA